MDESAQHQQRPRLSVGGLVGLLSLLLVSSCGGDNSESGETAAGLVPGEMPTLAAERVLADPPATGLVVLAIAPDGVAHFRGIVPGDVLVRYGERAVASAEDLRQAINAYAVDEDVALALVAPDGTERRVVRDGDSNLGLGLANFLPVEKGVGHGLPPASGPAPDLALLGAPLDEWVRFEIDGEHVGFEHGTLVLVDGVWNTRREVAFDGGERWGLNHMDVEAHATLEPDARPRLTTFEDVTNGWRSIGRLVETEAGPTWEVARRHDAENVETSFWRLPDDDLPTIPYHFVGYFARAMPLEVGACFRYRPLREGMSQTALPCALRVAAQQTIQHGDEEVEAWRIEHIRVGSSSVTATWIDARRRALRIEYVSATGMGDVTKKEALAGLPETVAPRAVAAD